MASTWVIEHADKLRNRRNTRLVVEQFEREVGLTMTQRFMYEGDGSFAHVCITLSPAEALQLADKLREYAAAHSPSTSS